MNCGTSNPTRTKGVVKAGFETFLVNNPGVDIMSVHLGEFDDLTCMKLSVIKEVDLFGCFLQ